MYIVIEQENYCFDRQHQNVFEVMLTDNFHYHILVDNIAKILPCDKTLSFI